MVERVTVTPRRLAFTVFGVVSICCASTACNRSVAPSPTVASLTISGNLVLSSIGQTSQLIATATLSNGTSQPVTAVWQSSNPLVATVAPATGLLTAIASGSSIVTATYLQTSETVAVTVTVPPTLIATLQTVYQQLSPQIATVGVADTVVDLYYTTAGTTNATTYSLNFGDGQTCGPTLESCNAGISGFPHTVYWFSHKYAAGNFTAQLTVSNGVGQAQATATAGVTTKSLSGTWVSGTGSDGCTGQRTLQLTQTDYSLAGTYTNPFGASSAIDGSSWVNDIRDVRVNMTAAGLVFYGVNIDGRGVNADASALSVQILVGDASCGQPTLTFQRR